MARDGDDECLSLEPFARGGGARRARSRRRSRDLDLLCGVDRVAGWSGADGDFEDEFGSPAAEYDDDDVVLARRPDSPSSMPAEWVIRLSDDGPMAGIDIH